jgi:Alpha/beta hydrolase domain
VRTVGLIRLEIVQREPYEGGAAFGDVGAYERIDAVAYYAVDPVAPANAGIVDLDQAARDADGLVHLSGDAVVLRPVVAANGNRVALMDIPNRGRRTMTGLFNRAVPDVPPQRRIPVGDGFLMRRGFSLVWCGWQWDVPRDETRMGLDAPLVLAADGTPATAWTQLRVQLPEDVAFVPLTDQHVGPIGNHEPIPTVDVDDAEAVLYVRDGLHSAASEVPRGRWRFALVAGGEVRTDPGHLWVDGGIRAGRIYDLVYRAASCRVAGAGLLAARDLGAFVRADRSDNPLAGAVDRVLVTGVSQTCRFIRHLLYLGLDGDEQGGRAIDGALGLVGGGRRGEFNHRGAQPSVQSTPSFGHRFPFADAAQDDPRTGRRDGVLDRAAAAADPPKLIFVDTGAEYWRGDASLAHTDVVDGLDVDDAPFVRRYLFASTQHSPGLAELNDLSPSGARGANPLNMLDYTPLYRCALVNLVRWVGDGVGPPASAVPRWSDHSALARDAALKQLSTIPSIELPDPAELPALTALDLGPDSDRGIGRYPARPFGVPYPSVVSALDDDGNEIAGVRLPDVSVPVATHLGFNPRHPATGGAGQIIDYSGSSVPFPRTAAERERLGDPRASLEERYPSLAAYEAMVRTAAEELVDQRLLLPEDVELCVRVARRRYLVVTAAPASPPG